MRTTAPAAASSSDAGPSSLSSTTSENSTPLLPTSIFSPEAFPARIFRTLAEELGLRETGPDSGSHTRTPYAFFDRASSSWRMSQASLLEDSGESCTTWPRQVTWDLQFVWEQQMSVRPIFEIATSFLLPTPNADESTPSEEYTEEMRDHLDPSERLYLPGRKYHVQRTLSRVSAALLPTPGANDSTGGEEKGSRERRGAGGPALRDLKSLLPTPTTQDASNNAGPAQKRRNSPPLNTAIVRLPTPTAQDGKHIQGDSNPHTLWSRLDNLNGGNTKQRSNVGSAPSDGQHPDQLMIEDG